jgi:hypothetical protein
VCNDASTVCEKHDDVSKHLPSVGVRAGFKENEQRTDEKDRRTMFESPLSCHMRDPLRCVS